MTTEFRSPARLNVRRIVIVAGAALLLMYALFVATGYLWVNYGLKNRRITLAQVALFRLHEVRHDLAVQQFAQANAALEKKDYPAAYLAFSSALRNDPDNVDCRLAAAQFFATFGSAKSALAIVQEGLERAPNDRRLIAQTFELLTASGGDARALELLHGRYASLISSPQETLLQRYEILATLNTAGAVTAKQLVDRYPALRVDSEAAPIVAQVWWESQERLKAIDLLAAYVRSGSHPFTAYRQLADWQSAGGLADDARQTADQACARFPREIPPRILQIDKLPVAGTEWKHAIESFLGDFGARADGLVLLADLAGRRGWVDVARSLYAVGAARFPDLNLLALAYTDALIRNSRFAEATQMLAQIEAQMPDNAPRFLGPLRDRQVMVAAALGDHDGAREFARRLAASLSDDPDALEVKRRYFARLKISEAVAELSRAQTGRRTAADK